MRGTRVEEPDSKLGNSEMKKNNLEVSIIEQDSLGLGITVS